MVGAWLQALSKFGDTDTAKITRDILLFLPSFNNGRPTRHGNELLQMLLTQAATSLKEDLVPGRNPANLEQSRLYLELSDLLCREKGASDPVQLLRFYCTSSLIGKMTLGRLSENARLFFIVFLAHALSACGHQPSPESGELASMRRQVVDALTIILPVRMFTSFQVFFPTSQPVFPSNSAVGCASMEVMRNAVANVSTGWWAMTLRED